MGEGPSFKSPLPGRNPFSHTGASGLFLWFLFPHCVLECEKNLVSHIPRDYGFPLLYEMFGLALGLNIEDCVG